MRYFTEGIDKYLASWIQIDTWYTSQDIEDRFYAFVMAIGRNSRPVRDETRSIDDADLKKYTHKEKLRIVNQRTCRNPRTSDKAAFVKKVLRAIKRNRPNFDQEFARELVERLADKAMMILDAMWYDHRTNHRAVKKIDMTKFK